MPHCGVLEGIRGRGGVIRDDMWWSNGYKAVASGLVVGGRPGSRHGDGSGDKKAKPISNMKPEIIINNDSNAG